MLVSAAKICFTQGSEENGRDGSVGKEFHRSSQAGYLGQLSGGPLDGSFVPLVFHGEPKRPETLTRSDVLSVPVRVQPEVLLEETEQLRHRVKEGELQFRMAAYVFDSIVELDGKLLPRFIFVEGDAELPP